MSNKKLYLRLAGLVVVVAVVVGIVVAGSGKKSINTMAGMDMSGTAAAANMVTIQDYMFMPGTITVKAGTTVTWTNKDSVAHTITADNPSNDAPNSMDIADGKSYSFTFKKAGTYTYHCFPHPYMHGTVKVTN